MVEDVLAVIPARYASTRFPGKPLAVICGKPMIEHVWKAATMCRSVSKVVVATDDARIRDAAFAFGAECVLTGPCETGTDRVVWVASEHHHPLVLNIQGDEPLLQPEWLDALIAPLRSRPTIQMSTLRAPIRDPREMDDPNVVKVVVRRDSTALYFSRARIPYPRERESLGFKHVGLYGYRRGFLLGYSGLPYSPLEDAEKLEQLRALEAGVMIAAPLCDIESVSVDRPEDIPRVELIMKSRQAAKAAGETG
ncbi:MAG: 3-deoxy-manno-octulosonate cytidylyltransferase [Acidobacteriota bacterium]